MTDKKPRRFFGLLCAHEWEATDRFALIGATSGRNAGQLVMLRCKHCGDFTWRRIVL